jgi:hypothetical protein
MVPAKPQISIFSHRELKISPLTPKETAGPESGLSDDPPSETREL